MVAPAAKGTVLVIDDEPTVRDLTGKMLERSGFGVRKASGGREGIAQFKACTEEIDVVMLDLTMPDLDGEAVFAAVRNERFDVPVVLMSGHERDQTRQWFAAHEHVVYLQKPYQRASLLSVLEQLLPR